MTVELRGEWPGGLETDPLGHAKYEVVVGAMPVIPGNEVVRPVWACRLCAKKLKHSKADHDLMLAAKKPAAPLDRIETRP